MRKFLKGLVELFTCREGPSDQQSGRVQTRLFTILMTIILVFGIGLIGLLISNAALNQATQELKSVGRTLNGLGTLAQAIQNSLPAPVAGQQPSTPPAPVFESQFVEVKSCPADTVLVSGDYCEGVSHACLESRPGNGCIKFKPGVAKCLGKVSHLEFCIDKYEWPNKAGVKPEVNLSWLGAKERCESVGKRLLDDDEWTLACEGPERLPFPYGWERDRTACNIDHAWKQWSDKELCSKDSVRIAAEIERLSQAVVPSGSMPRCVSPYGVNDMTGNVDEWALNHTGDGKPYASYVKGGHWIGGIRNRCRPATEDHRPDGRMYDAGGRCGSKVTVSLVRKTSRLGK